MRAAAGKLEIRGADTNNLRDVDVDIPLGLVVVVRRSGRVAGPKSSLIGGSVSGRDGVVAIDQGADPPARDGAPRRRTPVCSTRSARRSQRPTA